MDHFNFNYATILDAANHNIADTVPTDDASPVMGDGLNALQQPPLSSPPTRSAVTTIAAQPSLCSVARSGVEPVSVASSCSNSTTPITSITFSNPIPRPFQPLELSSSHFYNSANIQNILEDQKKIYREFTDKFNCISEQVNSFIQILDKLICQQTDLNLQFTTAFDYMSRDHMKQPYEYNSHHVHPYYHRRPSDMKNIIALPSCSQQYTTASLNHTQTHSIQSNNYTTHHHQQQQQQQHQPLHSHQTQSQKNGNVFKIKFVYFQIL